MRVVMYLSGKAGRSQQFYDEQDSVADSVTVPAGQEDAWVQLMYTMGLLDAVPTDWTTVVPQLDPGALDDLLSDWADNIEYGEVDPMDSMVAPLQRLLNNECSCGVIHLVK